MRLAVVGGRRGRSFGGGLRQLADRVQVVAICARTPETLEPWRAEWESTFSGLRSFLSYERLLDESDCDAVLLAMPMGLHASQSIAALRAGRHVLSEVPAATTLDECWALVEAAETSRRVYMMAENFCFMRPNTLVLNMVDQGVFGSPYYAEGSYIHDGRNMAYDAGGSLSWRGQFARDQVGNTYPTHSLGPVAQWLRTSGPGAVDRLTELVTWSTPSLSRQRYAERQLGAEHPTAQPGFFRGADSTTTLLRTAQGALIVLRRDPASPRPENWAQYALQGTGASYLSGRHDDEDPLVWIDGRSPGNSPSDYSRHGQPDSDEARWESLWNYSAEYEHPMWRERGHLAATAGHGGSDFFVLEAFVESVLGGGPPPVDVYDAVTWSSVIPLSAQSVASGGVTVAIPHFQRGPNGPV